MLDALLMGLLLCPFAFFWCCCKSVCATCPDGVKTKCTISFNGSIGTETEGCDDCEDILSLVFTVTFVPGGADVPQCFWGVTSDYEQYTEYGEGLCLTPFDQFGETYDLVRYAAYVSIAEIPPDGHVRVVLKAFTSPFSTDAGTMAWSMPMPGHSGSPPTGPCPAQTIDFDYGDYEGYSGGSSLLNNTCDWSLVEPQITFF